ncbi:copper resistance protein CopD [Haloplanus salinarum]|jgi:hypothetical protein|uniref:copper resistance protein CopD n=1 Tax=Haloplanus salinarum TaxID=1912324 RepID=UPI00214CF291|nr:copper resistance protein CopD [Haloplanus salinarum]
MDPALALSYVVHVVSAAFWTGGVLYAVYAVIPAASAGDLSPAAFARSVDGLLQVTRWTGVALPLTGAYQLWLLYSLPRLFGTTAGHLVLGMAALWTLMNGLVELGVYRMCQSRGDPPGLGAYFRRGFTLGGDADVPALADVGRPYFRAGAALATLLLVDAALLAGGV